MPTCPDCGSIIMEGDPYCSHCGAHLSWSGNSSSRRDSQTPNYMDYDDSSQSIWDYEKRRKELLEMICKYYKVKLDDLDVKDGYTEYIFFRKTPYYTLRIVATDQYGATIGVKENESSVDFTKLYENEDYKNLTRNLNVKNVTTSLKEDIIHIITDDGLYLLDMDNKKLIKELDF